LTRRGGVAEWDGPVDRSEATRTPHSRHGYAAAVVFVSSSFLVGALGAGVASLPPINVEDRHAVLAVHVGMMARRLANTKRRGQATVAKAEAARGQTTINQKVAEKMFKIILGLSNILNIIKENSGIHRGRGCGGRSRGQRFATAASVTIASEANSGNGGGRLTVPVAEAA